jgi:hypothetical protein
MGTEATSSGKDAAAASGMRVRDVVRDVVAKVAPEELAVVTGLAEFDDATVIRRLRRGARRREPLGFGWGDIVTMVAPVVWLVLNEAAQKAAGAAVDSATKGAKALVRKIFRRKSADVVVPPLTGKQLDQLRARLLEVAAQQGIAAERAEDIVEEVLKRLAAGDPPEDPPEPGEPNRS